MKALFILILLGVLLNGYSQDIVFKNPENRVMLDYLDTSISVNGGSVNLDIGPKQKLPKNTIFFNGPFEISNAKVDSVRIRGSFLRHLIIDSSDFSQKIVVIDSTEFDTLFIRDCKFAGSLVFKDVYINDLRLIRNSFRGNISFINCKFPNIDILNTVFPKTVSFMFCRVGNAIMTQNNFKEGLTFSQNTLDSLLMLDRSKFDGMLDLSFLNTSPDAYITLRCELPDALNLTNINFLVDTLDLTSFSDSSTHKCMLSVERSNLSKLHLNYKDFKLRFIWQMSNDEKESVYIGLLENFQRYSYQESYKSLDIEYKRYKSKQGTFGFLWWVPDIWWQFGYDRGRIFTIVFWSLLFFTIVNYIFLNYLVGKVYGFRSIPVYYPTFSWRRLWFALVYTLIVFFSLSIKIDRIQFRHKAGSAYLMGLYVFGIICLAYMANYIIQK